MIPTHIFSNQQPLPSHPWFQDGKRRIILGAGELCYRKDFRTLIQAFSILIRTVNDLMLIILGRGRDKANLLRFAKKVGVKSRVSLPGFIENPYPFMAHSALFAHTSRWEGLGFVLLEALAMGTPCVATDCPHGPREILDNGRYGALVPVGDPHSLAQAMETSLAERPTPEQLKEAARPYEVKSATKAYLHAMGLE